MKVLRLFPLGSCGLDQKIRLGEGGHKPKVQIELLNAY